MKPLIGLPSDDPIPSATLSMTNEDADYPVENAQNEDPADTAKATGTSTVVTVTLPSAMTIVLASVAQTNATSMAVSNDATLNQTITVPSRTWDGKSVNGWKALTGVANNTDDVWYFTLSKTGTAPLEFGRLILLVALREPHWVWAGAGPSPQAGLKRPGEVEHMTRLGSVRHRASPTQYRTFRATQIDAAELPLLRQLEAECRGLSRGFVLIPDEDVNDLVFARIPKGLEFMWSVDQPDVRTAALDIHEISMGLPPSLA